MDPARQERGWEHEAAKNVGQDLRPVGEGESPARQGEDWRKRHTHSEEGQDGQQKGDRKRNESDGGG